MTVTAPETLRKTCARRGCLREIVHVVHTLDDRHRFEATPWCSLDCAMRSGTRTPIAPDLTVPYKRCRLAGCESVIVVEHGRLSRFYETDYCSRACRDRARTLALIGPDGPPSKPCKLPGCDGRVVQIGGKRARFDRTSFCSDACRGRYAALVRERRPILTKPCEREGCDGVVTSEKIPPSRWRKRRFCSRECKEAASALPIQRKPCAREGCDGEVVERGVRFEKGIYCSRSCARKAHAAEQHAKDCERCGKTFYRGTRPRAEFERRRYCSVDCANVARRGVPVRRGPVTRRTEQRRRKAAEHSPRKPRSVSVFGDAPPTRPWRPAGFAPTPKIPTRPAPPSTSGEDSAA